MPPKLHNGLFSKNKDKILIEMVRMNPVLYDDGHDHFRDSVMKHLIWENIAAAIDVPVPVVKKRWRHFRDHYLKKCRERASGRVRTRRSGNPTWEYMQRLEFLSFLAGRKRPGSSPSPEFLAGRKRPGSSPSPDPAALHESVIYVVPPGEHDSFSEPENTEHAAKRPRHSPETVDISSSPSPTPDELQLSVSTPYSEAVHPMSPPPAPVEERSAVHKFFDSMADIVVQFPPALAAEARLQVCQLVNELEKKSQEVVGCPRCQPHTHPPHT